MSTTDTVTLTLTLDSTTLYTTALTTLTSQPQPLPHPLPPPPSSLPHPKLIPKTRFIVDGFKHASDFSISYFLSHFHSDHYTGLNSNWSKGVIFCSATTARLLIDILKVPAPFVIPLPLSERVVIDGSEVFLIDANHCPGAVQFLFKVRVSDGKFEKYVHTGDFRYCDGMKSMPVLNEFIGADAVFLDTTYCNPKYVFPSQKESIDYVVSVVERIGAENNEGKLKKVLFLVATYVVGKERILVEIARRCKRKVCVDSRKMAILSVLELGGSGVFTEDESESDVHVVGWNVLGETWPYFRPNFVKMNEIMKEKGYSKVVGFVPTGWTYETKRNKFSVRTKDSFEIHLVPYSEHSNYEELRDYVKFLKPKCVIPTVGVDVEKHDSKHVCAIRKHFAGLLDDMAIKQEFLMGFQRMICVADEKFENDEASAANVLLEQESEGISSDPNCNNDVEEEETVNLTCPKQELLSGDLSENDVKEFIEELRVCLPSWVTQDQMLDLFRNSGGNMVEAVSNFYEHETEFHEQVTGPTSFDCIIPESLKIKVDYSIVTQNESVLPSNPSSVKFPPGTLVASLSQSYKSFSVESSNKSGMSPGKRKRSVENKRNKKSRTNSTLEKQHTITKFFTKVLPLGTEENKDGTEIAKDHHCQTVLPLDVNELYKREVDQFIQIINGDESLKSHAASIMEKAKGDVNVALDIYYSDAGAIAENKRNSSETMKPVQSESNQINSSSDQDVEAAENRKNESDLPLPELAKDRLIGSYVSLPPERYSPLEHACWKNGQAAPYLHLARTFDLVEDERGKIKATSMFCNMFRSLLLLSPEDVLPAVYLCTNKIAPDHENMELNIGGSIVVSALEEACGTNKSKIRELYNNLGDLGDVAQLSRQTQSLLAPPAPLTIRGVYTMLRKISVQTGNRSTTRKKNLIVNLMCSCREKEMKYLVRTLVRNLRIGAMMRTVLPALAHAVVMNSGLSEGIENMKEHLQSLSAAVVEAYNILPSLDLLIPLILEKGIRFSSTTLSMVPGIPIKPMLAKITNGASQLLKLFENKAFTCEYKYDGQRAQIHRLADGTVHVFSRNGDETTSRFPDLVNTIKELCDPAASTFILDAEVVAIDRKNGGKLMSFQELSSRERGNKDSLITVDMIKVDICIFVFDIMLANGKQLLGHPLRERRKYLKDLLKEEKVGYLEYAREMTVESDEACPDNEATLMKINSFLEDALRSSCEGMMVKSLDFDAGYAPSKRSDAWLKVKRDYVEGLSDSLDLVPIGAWYGNGRKAGWYSPFLMACYNPETEEFQSVCRVMSGFSDSFYTEIKDFFSGDKILAKKPPYYRTGEAPDMWFSPELVWVIRGADFTVSPVHHAAFGLVHPSRGISVRFPRFIRSVTDRKPEECSTAADIADMFQSQTRKMDVSVKN